MRIAALVAVVALAALSCTAEQEEASVEGAAEEETAAEESTSNTSEATTTSKQQAKEEMQKAAASGGQGAGGVNAERNEVQCMIGTAYYDGYGEEAEQLAFEAIEEAIGEPVELPEDAGPRESGEAIGNILGRSIIPMQNLPAVMKEHGYYCDVQKYQSTLREQREAVAREHREAQEASGKNEAGQDISNIPKTERSPERGKCLSDYYNSLPRDQRGPESQRVTAEANRQGVTPYDVVGC